MKEKWSYRCTNWSGVILLSYLFNELTSDLDIGPVVQYDPN